VQPRIEPRKVAVWASGALALILTLSLLHVAAGRGGGSAFNAAIRAADERMFAEGQQTFRFDTFGDEAFWGDTLKLHQAIEGSQFGGVGQGLSPSMALSLGLKVDSDALPQRVIQQIRHKRINLDDPAVTLQLLKANAVLGVTGFFQGMSLKSAGIQCAIRHSTVDNSIAFGIGHRLDGWPNRDLNVGAIVATAPDLTAFATLLNTTQDQVRTVLNSWGPGKFDAELILDGKAFNPDAPPTVPNKSAATMIPPAFGLAGINLHTWTGWGSVPCWNAFVANLEMHGVGTFFDPRLDDAAQFPIAAAHGFGHVQADPDSDRITKKLPGLHYYQMSLPAPKPVPGVDFDPAAAKRGDDLFGDKAKCNSCHREPLWTEPGWNLHLPAEVGVETFQADRAPDHRYRTSPLAGIFTRELGLFMQPDHKGRFYHDGRFITLLDVVNHYNDVLGLGLSAQEKSDLVEYLKSL
jgi:hypothetical protein